MRGPLVAVLDFRWGCSVSEFSTTSNDLRLRLCDVALSNERLTPIIFASVLSIASKVLIRLPLANGSRTHVFNPSNFGIVATLLLFPAVGQAPPYQFTSNAIVTGVWHWALPVVILATESLFTVMQPGDCRFASHGSSGLSHRESSEHGSPAQTGLHL